MISQVGESMVALYLLGVLMGFGPAEISSPFSLLLPSSRLLELPLRPPLGSAGLRCSCSPLSLPSA